MIQQDQSQFGHTLESHLCIISQIEDNFEDNVIL